MPDRSVVCPNCLNAVPCAIVGEVSIVCTGGGEHVMTQGLMDKEERQRHIAERKNSASSQVGQYHLNRAQHYRMAESLILPLGNPQMTGAAKVHATLATVSDAVADEAYRQSL